MKKLLILPGILIAFGLGFVAHQPQAKLIKQTITSVKTQTVQAVPKIYGIGDTQDGITLIGEYPFSYTDRMAGNGPTPPTINVVYLALSGTTTEDLYKHSLVLTTSLQPLLPSSGPYPTIPACGDYACVGFEPQSLSLGTFTYKTLSWSL